MTTKKNETKSEIHILEKKLSDAKLFLKSNDGQKDYVNSYIKSLEKRINELNK